MTKLANPGDRKFTALEIAEHRAEEYKKVLLNTQATVGLLERQLAEALSPVPMLLTCPSCGARHLDEGEFATKHHHTHACQSCGMCWRPAVVATVGVRFLPGFKNAHPTEPV